MKSAKIDGREFKRLLRLLGFSFYKRADPRFKNVLIRSVSNGLEMILTCGISLAWCKFPAELDSGSDELSIIAPYMDVIRASRALAANGKIEISSAATEDKDIPTGLCRKAIFRQGGIRTEIECSIEPFAKFEKLIKALDFSRTCRVDTAAFAAACAILRPLSDEFGVQLSFDPSMKALRISIPHRVENITIPLKPPIEGEAMEIVVSRNHLCRLSAATAGDLEFQFSFSGEKTLVRVEARNASFFFAPVNHDE